MEHGRFIRSNVVCPRGRGREDGSESCLSRKPRFRIIYAMMKMIPPRPETVAGNSGHFFSKATPKPAARIGVFLIELLRNAQTVLFCLSRQFQKSHFDGKISEQTSGQNYSFWLCNLFTGKKHHSLFCSKYLFSHSDQFHLLTMTTVL